MRAEGTAPAGPGDATKASSSLMSDPTREALKHLAESLRKAAGIAEPRYASLKGIMAARSKEIKQVGLGDLAIERGDGAETIEGLTDAETRKAGAVIEFDGTSIDRIIQVLAEAKVI